MQMRSVGGVLVLLTACGTQTGSPAESPAASPGATDEPAATAFDHVAAREACEAQGKRYSRAIQQCHGELPDPDRTPRPVPTAAPVDPDLAFQVFRDTFAQDSDDLFTALADALEVDYYWIESVDRIGYDPETHLLTLDITVAFESVFLYDPQEWRNDTWTVYRDVARDFWGPFVQGFGDSAFEGVELDWPRWLPSMRLNANAGRLAVECPGSLSYAVIQRQATQAEFESECTFAP